MSQNIEIEFKNLVTEEEFTRLRLFLNIEKAHFFEQENHYFDSDDFSLKRMGAALRIRQKEDRYELTLKQPNSIGLLETNDDLSETEFKEMIQHSILPDGSVKDILLKLSINLTKLNYLGALMTKRAEKEYKKGLIVLDHSFYFNQSDYEVEYEVDDFQTGQEEFNHLLKELQIPIRETENKINRYYKAKLKYKSN